MKDKILEVLKESPGGRTGREEIIAKTGGTDQEVSAALAWLANRSLIDKVSFGIFEITDKGIEFLERS
ncbi:MAG: hypothetical protein K8I02_03220 [Candidatus Methylomirabilis sp.]|nr:hypothetical protein [Deltaproteobacteria bacterium]